MKSGHRVVVLDNDTGHRAAVDKKAIFCPGDLHDLKFIHDILASTPISWSCILPPTASSPVHAEPLLRHRNLNTINLLEAMKAGVRNWSSSMAAVYGSPWNAHPEPSSEPTNPWQSKAWIEAILSSCTGPTPDYISLCYFNAAGADPEGELGEEHHPETHLIPIILKAALQGEEVSVFGSDYPTKDGTPVRDYIHVSDLISAHLLAMEALLQGRKQREIYNLGHQRGYSVLEVIDAARQVTGLDIPYRMADRRGTLPQASSAKGKAERAGNYATATCRRLSLRLGVGPAAPGLRLNPHRHSRSGAGGIK